MEVIIAVPSTFRDLDLLQLAVAKSGFPISAVVSAGRLAEEWAKASGTPVRRMALPGRPGKTTADRCLAQTASALIAIWDGENRKMAGMIRAALAARLDVFIFSPG